MNVARYKMRWEYAAVFLGGAAGSMLRGIAIPSLPTLDWVTATFMVNMAACFILGWLYAIRHRVHAHVMHLGAVGFCGGLSTFSTYAAEIYNIMVVGAYISAVTASLLEIACGIGIALVGERIGRRYHSEDRS